MFRLFSTAAGIVIERHGAFFTAPTAFTLDTLFTSTDPHALLGGTLATAQTTAAPASVSLLAPVRSQEVWAAGVTYYRSRSARMAESVDASGGTFYDKVYEADRPEIFFKATPHRVAAPNTGVRIRADSKWNVPEPELTLAITSAGKIFGYTLGNDMSSRDIEGANPLYLPQAKVYDRCAALGPCLVVTEALPAADAVVALEIRRIGTVVYSGETTLGQIKRSLPSLADWLFRDNAFPHGAYLMTGTGIVPPDAFTLQSSDEIRITLAAVGTLMNFVL